LLLASSNVGKLREFQAFAGPLAQRIELGLLKAYSSLPEFEESHPTFGENAVGKAIHYSRDCAELVMADDSGLVVPALHGAPGVQSARYAGPNATDADRNAKLLAEMRALNGEQRCARYVCVLALARQGQVRGVFSAAADGVILDKPSGAGGFGYDPIFFCMALGKTYAEISQQEKNQHSHRGKAFRKLLDFLML